MITKILRLSLIGLVGFGIVSTVDAAPTVKKFGGNNITSVKADNSSVSRVGSVRLNTSNTVKPATVKTSVATNSNTVDSNSSRISLGKYLHGANVVKQNAAQAAYEDPNLASRDSLILRDKISEVEGDVSDIKQEMTDHINNTVVHVTTEDKEIWNEKQDALTAGDGIKIDGRVISSVVKVPVGSEHSTTTVPMWLE